jgi:hypothetical protein
LGTAAKLSVRDGRAPALPSESSSVVLSSGTGPGVGPPPGRSAEEMGQPVDRDHQYVVLDALHATHPDEAQHGDRAVARPSSPAPRQPRRLLMHAGEVALVIGPRFRLDRNCNPGRGDRHRVDVSPPLPREGMPQPPALRLKGRERALDLVFRAGTHATAASKREPVPRLEAESDGGEEQQTADQRGSRARDQHPQQRGRGAAGRRPPSPGEPAELLAARVVQSGTSSPIASMPRIVAPPSDVSQPRLLTGPPWRGNNGQPGRATPDPGARGYPCFVPTRREFVPSARSRAHTHRYSRVSAPGNGIGTNSVGYGESADLQAGT